MPVASRAPLVERNVPLGDDWLSAKLICSSNGRSCVNMGSVDSCSIEANTYMHGTSAGCLPPAQHTAHQHVDLDSVIEQFQTLRRPSCGRASDWHQVHVPADAEEVSKYKDDPNEGPGCEDSAGRTNGQQQDPRLDGSSTCEPREHRLTAPAKAHLPASQATRFYRSSSLSDTGSPALPGKCSSSKESIYHRSSVGSSDQHDMCSSKSSDTLPLTVTSQPCPPPDQVLMRQTSSPVAVQLQQVHTEAHLVLRPPFCCSRVPLIDASLMYAICMSNNPGVTRRQGRLCLTVLLNLHSKVQRGQRSISAMTRSKR